MDRVVTPSHRCHRFLLRRCRSIEEKWGLLMISDRSGDDLADPNAHSSDP